MTCLIEFLDTVTTCSQGWQTLAAMLIKRRNFDRNYLNDPPERFSPNFAELTFGHCTTETAKIWTVQSYTTPVNAGQRWESQ